MHVKCDKLLPLAGNASALRLTHGAVQDTYDRSDIDDEQRRHAFNKYVRKLHCAVQLL